MSPILGRRCSAVPPRDNNDPFSSVPKGSFSKPRRFTTMNRSTTTAQIPEKIKPQLDGLHFSVKSPRGCNPSIHRSKPVWLWFSNISQHTKKHRQTQKARPPHRRSGLEGSVEPNQRSQTTSAYICSGAETPTRVSTRASVTRTASQAARRARESSGSTGRPSLGRTWQAA